MLEQDYDNNFNLVLDLSFLKNDSFVLPKSPYSLEDIFNDGIVKGKYLFKANYKPLYLLVIPLKELRAIFYKSKRTKRVLGKWKIASPRTKHTLCLNEVDLHLFKKREQCYTIPKYVKALILRFVDGYLNYKGKCVLWLKE